MKLLDRFKRKRNEPIEETPMPMKEDWTKDLNITLSRDRSMVKIEFYDREKSNTKGFKDEMKDRYYTTTRLYVDIKRDRLGNSTVYNCRINWGNQGDMEFFDISVYDKISASFDPNRMINDEAYCKYAMRNFFNRDRVNGYLEKGMSSKPQENPCGYYIGGIRQKENGQLENYFDRSAGKESHYSYEMIQMREEAKRRKEQERVALEKQIQEAQRKLDTYYK